MDRSGIATRAEPTLWRRGIATYADGWIVLDPARSEPYLPMTKDGLHIALANVITPADAVGFVRAWGLLWNGPQSETTRERFVDWEETALGMMAAMKITASIRRALAGDADALGEIRNRWMPMAAGSFQPPPADDKERLQALSTRVATLASNGLAGVEERIEPAWRWGSASNEFGRPGDFFLSIQAKHLVHHAWHSLAMDVLVNRAPLRECSDADCGRIFLLDDPRQRYCSPACSSRARQRRYVGKDKRKLDSQSDSQVDGRADADGGRNGRLPGG